MNIDDEVLEINAKLDTLAGAIADLTSAIKAIQAPVINATDLSPVLAAIADIKAQLVPTPPAA